MKKTVLFISCLLSLNFGYAQAPEGVGYQGVATDANAIELVNQAISIRASVLSGSATGTIEWEETHTTTTDTFGLFTLTIGQGTNTTNGAQTSFGDISWGTNTHFLKIEMDVNGGSNFSFMGTNQMMSVPYALYAESAGTFPSGTAAGEINYWNGTSWVGVTPGSNGQTLTFCNGVPIWGSCFGAVYGCTDTTATNYNSGANTDDGSCTYTNNGVAIGYYFHGGNADYPYAQDADGLTAANPGNLYYNTGTATAPQYTIGDLSTVMTWIINQGGTSTYNIESFPLDSNGDILGLGTSDVMSFVTSSFAEYYYVALPQLRADLTATADLTSTTPQHLVDGGLETNAVQNANFLLNGNAWTLYRLGGNANTISRDISFSDND